jgi:ComF family protein
MLAPSLAGLLHKYMMTRCDVSYNSVDLILPVPIHDAKRRLRGYNQSQLLAAELSGLCGIPGEWKAVKRRASAHAQVELSRSERLRNVQGAFRVVLPEVIRGKRILLIDDVATTCSTVHECSLALLDAGASRVYVLCLAFGS